MMFVIFFEQDPVGLLNLGAPIFQNLLFFCFNQGILQRARLVVIHKGFRLVYFLTMETLIVGLPFFMKDAIEFWKGSVHY
jgi:hypothetical protein